MLVFLVLFTLLTGTAQTDTVTYSSEQKPIEKIKIIDAYDYVFLTQEETKALFKLNLLPALNATPTFTSCCKNLNAGIGTALEVKLSESVSINNEFGFNYFYSDFIVFTQTDSFSSGPDPSPIYEYKKSRNNSTYLRYTFEPRWYFQMKKRIANEESADNLTGTYLSLPYSVEFHKFKRPRLAEKYGQLEANASVHTFGLRIGTQRRIFKNGYIDVHAGFGYSVGNTIKAPFSSVPPSQYFMTKRANRIVSVSTGVKLGIAFGKVSKEYNVNKCEVLKCFFENDDLFKINLINAISVSNNIANGRLSIGYEKKLGSSPFSINADVWLRYSFIIINQFSGPGNNLIFGDIALEPRFYYSLRKRIANGKSANNLSADYVSLTFRTNAAFHNLMSTGGRFRYSTLSPAWGVQRRLFEFAFIDLKIGYHLVYFYDTGAQFAPTDSRASNVFFTEFKLGLAF